MNRKISNSTVDFGFFDGFVSVLNCFCPLCRGGRVLNQITVQEKLLILAREKIILMSIEKSVAERSGNCCELCGSSEALSLFVVAPKAGLNADEVVHVCKVCKDQLTEEVPVDANHWRCLNDSMWSEVPAVKVVAYRMLNALKAEGWPVDLLEMMYLDDETLAWAKSGVQDDSEKLVHRDSNGAILNNGDTVVIIKDLNVKGANFTAKRGTAVRNITLVHDHADQIEGRVEGQKIVILTQYVKK